MSGLFGMLGATARALDAQRFGLDVTGQNLANINTPGYTRRVIDFGAIPPSDPRLNAGHGVDVLGVRAQRDLLFERRLLQELPLEQREAAIADALAIAEAGLGQPGKTLDNKLGAFFDAWSALADAPTSATARSQVVSQGQTLASEFRNIAGRLDASSRDLDTRVRATVDEVNALASQIAALNKKIASSRADATLHLQDERAEALNRLSGLVAVQTVELDDSTIQVSFGFGRPLVVGDQVRPMGLTNQPVTGVAQITSDGVDVTKEIAGGRLAGLIHTRDTLIPDYRTRLDTLAYQVVQQVNTLHDAGATLNGADAPLFFQPLASSANAASLMTVNAALVADHSQVAAAAAGGAAGDNRQARALANLRDAKVMSGGTASFGDYWAQLVYRVGQDGRAAGAEQQSRAEVVRQVENLRDSVSGVSVDEEAAMMMRFQRAYEANARFFATIDETLETLLNLGR